MDTQEYLQSLVDAARAAQKEFEKMSQEQVDAAAKAIGKAIYDHAEELAKMAVEETRMGRVDSKIAIQEHLVAHEGPEEPRDH